MKLLKIGSALVILFFGHVARLHAAAPAIQWTTRLDNGAKVFSVDSGTNVYVQSGTNVIKLNGNGLPLTTNALPGALTVKGDAAGNLYYVGKHTGEPAGSYTCYSETNLSFFMIKLSPAGTTLWHLDFGISNCVQVIQFTDLALDENTNIYAGYWTSAAP